MSQKGKGLRLSASFPHPDLHHLDISYVGITEEEALARGYKIVVGN